jgi:hypothetical protein
MVFFLEGVRCSVPPENLEGFWEAHRLIFNWKKKPFPRSLGGRSLKMTTHIHVLARIRKRETNTHS